MQSFTLPPRWRQRKRSSGFATPKARLTEADIESFFSAADSRDRRTNTEILEAVLASDRKAMIQVSRAIKRFKRALARQNVDPSRYKEFL